MFPKTFKKDYKKENYTHHGIIFRTQLSYNEVLGKIKEMGFSEFLSPAKRLTYSDQQYPDKRITNITFNHATCCSFTKVVNAWMAFPIRDWELENAGINSDDLVTWLKYLNGMRIGLKYLYFGKQKPIVNTGNTYENANWVLVPPAPTQSYNVSYLHWICLRYLVNTFDGGSPNGIPYNIVPRITMMLHKEHKLSKFRAFLFAHLAARVNYYYGLLPSDLINPNGRYIWDVSVKAIDFKKILFEKSGSHSINDLMTEGVSKDMADIRAFVKPTYHIDICIELFNKGDYAGFVKYIRDSYKSKTKITKIRNVRKEVVG